jgi:excisionase family DNA binding protein
MPDQTTTQPTRRLYKIKDAAELLSISTWKVYKLADEGRLESVYQDSGRFITAAGLDAYVDSLSSTPPAKDADA